MTVNSDIAADIIQPAIGNVVTLFELDLTDLGGSTVHFTPSGVVDESTPIAFDGTTYFPRDVVVKGFAASGQGKQPRPRVSVSNLDGAISDYCRDFRNMVGATLTRKRTLAKYLDGEPGANPNAEFPREIWEVSKKMSQSKLYCEFELQPYLDRQGRKIPGRVVLTDTCGFAYRYYLGGGFVYPEPLFRDSCPYTGSSYFKRDGTATGTASEDDCGKRLSDCKLRFGSFSELPYNAFPGVDRIQRY